MSDLLQAFILGNGAILTNACILPLYPGLIAFLSSNVPPKKAKWLTILLGVMVLAGVLTMMLGFGLVLYGLEQSLGAALGWILPLVYGIVILLGLMTLLGYDPFARLGMVPVPGLRNPWGAAYGYGLLLGPMTLPCTGPIITSAFLLSLDSQGNLAPSLLAQELLYFGVFGLGFGWPLLLIPMVAIPLQRRFVGWISQNHRPFKRLAGALLVAIGIYGICTELLPNLTL